MRLLRMALIIAILSLGAACGGAAAAPGEAPQDASGSTPVPVRVAPVVEEVITVPVIVTGTLGPKEEIPLGFKIGGIIEQIAVDEGDVVREGMTLAALEQGEIEATMRRARSGAAKAERDLARTRRLHADSVATLAQLQDAETAAEVAHAELAAAEFDRRYARITAPADGVILKRTAEGGEMVGPSAPVLLLGSRERGTVVRVGLADSDVMRVRRGDPAIVTFNALPGRAFEGRVSELAAAAQARAGTYTAEIALQEADALPAGLVGRVEIRPSARSKTAVIPIEALLEADGDRATVYALSPDGSRAQRRSITIAFVSDGRIAVDAGLEGVESVLVEGAAYVDDGSAVRVTP